MANAQLERTTVNISVTSATANHNGYYFQATGEVVKFDGFLRVYRESQGDDDNANATDESRLLPPMSEGQNLQNQEIVAQQRFTQQPPRYTELRSCTNSRS